MDLTYSKKIGKKQQKVISSDTPDKLREIIQDTWPNLYRPPKVPYNTSKLDQPNDWKSGTRGESDVHK